MRNELETLDIFGRPLKAAIEALSDLDKAIASRMTELSQPKNPTDVGGEKHRETVPVPAQSGFVLGPISQKNLMGVHPMLVQVVKVAITITTHDFRVYEGVRDIEQQKLNIKRGVSKTMDSKHLIQKDGLGHAVDLVPMIRGIPKWDWIGCYKVAQAMKVAASNLGVDNKIRWGGVWDRTLNEVTDPYAEVQKYQQRHAGSDFLDGPHFELV